MKIENSELERKSIEHFGVEKLNYYRFERCSQFTCGSVFRTAVAFLVKKKSIYGGITTALEQGNS
jgi:hypothetical protein